MINLEKCKNIFEEYVKTYGMKNEKIYLKYYHTMRVVDLSRKIGESLGLSKENIEICELIGLLHDIGRFEQIKIYNTFIDKDSIDHAEFGVNLLLKNDFISNFVDNEKIKKIIITSIKNHNKFKISNNVDEKTLLFCKIIRDADKLDIFRIFLDGKVAMPHTDSKISPKELELLLSGKATLDIYMKTDMDYYLRHFGMLYDLNFDYSKNYVRKESIGEKLIDLIIKNNRHEEDDLLKIKEVYYKSIGGNLC